MDGAKKADRISSRSNSFSISSILADNNKTSRHSPGHKNKNNECNEIAIGRQGVAQLLPPNSLYGPVRVALENKGLWDMFHEVGTEMVITKSGRYFIFMEDPFIGSNDIG